MGAGVRRLLLTFIVIVGAANFFAFWVIAVAIGGDAINGHEAGGHYFLAAHGGVTEVSRELFTYSLWHARSVFVTQPLAMLSAYLLSRDRKRGNLPFSGT